MCLKHPVRTWAHTQPLQILSGDALTPPATLWHRRGLCHRREHAWNSPNKKEAGQEARRGLWTGPASPHTTE